MEVPSCTSARIIRLFMPLALLIYIKRRRWQWVNQFASEVLHFLEKPLNSFYRSFPAVTHVSPDFLEEESMLVTLLRSLGGHQVREFHALALHWGEQSVDCSLQGTCALPLLFAFSLFSACKGDVCVPQMLLLVPFSQSCRTSRASALALFDIAATCGSAGSTDEGSSWKSESHQLLARFKNCEDRLSIPSSAWKWVKVCWRRGRRKGKQTFPQSLAKGRGILLRSGCTRTWFLALRWFAICFMLPLRRRIFGLIDWLSWMVRIVMHFYLF